MDRPSANVRRVMRQAAAMRASGATWATAARKVGRSVRTCLRWRAMYPALWRRWLRMARRRAAREAHDEAILALRALLRSAEEKLRLSAAQALLKARPPRRTVRTEAAVAGDQLRDHSDEQLRDALRDALQTFEAVARDADPTGPDRSQ